MMAVTDIQNLALLQQAQDTADAALARAQAGVADVQARIAAAMASGDVAAAATAHSDAQAAADLVESNQSWLDTVRAQVNEVSRRVAAADVAARLADANRAIAQGRTVLAADVDLIVAQFVALKSAIRTALGSEDDLARLMAEASQMQSAIDGHATIGIVPRPATNLLALNRFLAEINGQTALQY